MKVSIVMCCYNEERFIERAIHCILQQTYTNWELIIADDGSTDTTQALIKNYIHDPRILYLVNDSNLGCQRNKNQALLRCTGALITQLDADDTCPNDRIEKQVNVFIEHTDAMICGTNFQIVNQEGTVLAKKEYEQDFWIGSNVKPYPFWFPGLMFKKKLLDEFGMYHPHFFGIHGEDHYWTIRVNKQYPIYFIKDVLYNYHINPNSVTNVLDNPRKLIVEEILEKLNSQQNEWGTDWLEQGKPELLLAYEQELMLDSTLMGDKYRIWAAKAIDSKKFQLAFSLLKQSFTYNKLNYNFYRTLAYYFRSRWQ